MATGSRDCPLCGASGLRVLDTMRASEKHEEHLIQILSCGSCGECFRYESIGTIIRWSKRYVVERRRRA
jgi:hypothetical protein